MIEKSKTNLENMYFKYLTSYFLLLSTMFWEKNISFKMRFLKVDSLISFYADLCKLFARNRVMKNKKYYFCLIYFRNLNLLWNGRSLKIFVIFFKFLLVSFQVIHKTMTIFLMFVTIMKSHLIFTKFVNQCYCACFASFQKETMMKKMQ